MTLSRHGWTEVDFCDEDDVLAYGRGRGMVAPDARATMGVHAALGGRRGAIMAESLADAVNRAKETL